VLERARRGWRGEVALMPCRFVCGSEEKRTCTIRNAVHALDVHGACEAWSERGSGGGVQVAWVAPSHWALGAVSRGAVGAAAGDGLPPTPRPPSCACRPTFRERGLGGEVESAWGLQVGFWGSSGAVLVAGWW
jgi:hypothetical protein